MARSPQEILEELLNTPAAAGFTGMEMGSALSVLLESVAYQIHQVEYRMDLLCDAVGLQFSGNGSLGFSQQSSLQELKFYLDRTRGDDCNDGLTSATPKLTLEGLEAAFPPLISMYYSTNVSVNVLDEVDIAPVENFVKHYPIPIKIHWMPGLKPQKKKEIKRRWAFWR